MNGTGTPENVSPHRLAIRNVRIAQRDDTALFDVLVEDGRVREITSAGSLAARMPEDIDGGGAVALPGLCDAHAHSHELFMRGSIWGVPLEPYIILNDPQFSVDNLPTADDLYTKTLAAAAEMLTGGVTLVADDVIHPSLDDERVDAVLMAYEDIGMRANVSIMVQDLPWRRSIPFVEQLVPPQLQSLLDQPIGSGPELVDFCKRTAHRWAGRSERVQLMMSPSAPQRSSPALLEGLWRVSRDYDLRLHIHVQETVAQSISGPMFFDGRSMLAYIDDLRLLDERTTIVHGVWLTDDDMHRVAASGASVVHNPTSNLKLGSGVARVSDMLDAGINVALGCDGYTCNDRQDMFEAMKNACLLSCIAEPEPEHWLGPDIALAMATVSGYQANGRDSAALNVGSVADLILVNPSVPAFVPPNDLVAQSVFGATSRDVTTVVVDGKVLVRDGQTTRIGSSGLAERVNEAAARFRAQTAASLNRNAALLPYFNVAYQRSVSLARSDGEYRLIKSNQPRAPKNP